MRIKVFLGALSVSTIVAVCLTSTAALGTIEPETLPGIFKITELQSTETHLFATTNDQDSVMLVYERATNRYIGAAHIFPGVLHFSRALTLIQDEDLNVSVMFLVTLTGRAFAIQMNGIIDEIRGSFEIDPSRITDLNCGSGGFGDGHASIRRIGNFVAFSSDGWSDIRFVDLRTLDCAGNYDLGRAGYGPAALSTDGSRYAIADVRPHPSDEGSQVKLFEVIQSDPDQLPTLNELYTIPFANDTNGIVDLSASMHANPTPGSDDFFLFYTDSVRRSAVANIGDHGVGAVAAYSLGYSDLGGGVAFHRGQVKFLHGARAVIGANFLPVDEIDLTLVNSTTSVHVATNADGSQQVYVARPNEQYIRTYHLDDSSDEAFTGEIIESISETGGSGVYRLDETNTTYLHGGTDGRGSWVNQAAEESIRQRRVVRVEEIASRRRIFMNQAALGNKNVRPLRDFYGDIQESGDAAFALLFADPSGSDPIDRAYLAIRDQETGLYGLEYLPYATKECFRTATGHEGPVRPYLTWFEEDHEILEEVFAADAPEHAADCVPGGTALNAPDDVFEGAISKDSNTASSGFLGCGLLTNSGKNTSISTVLFLLVLSFHAVVLRRRQYRNFG